MPVPISAGWRKELPSTCEFENDELKKPTSHRIRIKKVPILKIKFIL